MFPKKDLAERIGGVAQGRNTANSRQQLAEDIDILSGKQVSEAGNPGDVAAEMRETRDNPHADRIARAHHYDRNLFSGALCCEHLRREPCRENVDLQSDQFGGQGRQSRDIATGRPDFDADIPSLDVTEFTQPLHELVNRRFALVAYYQHADHRYLRLLRQRREARHDRRRGDRTGKGNEFSPSHSQFRPFAFKTTAIPELVTKQGDYRLFRFLENG
jgi:hypothetical protein